MSRSSRSPSIEPVGGACTDAVHGSAATLYALSPKESLPWRAGCAVGGGVWKAKGVHDLKRQSSIQVLP
jgi:hypothetical protein